MMDLLIPLVLPLTISALVTAIVIGAEARQRKKASLWRTTHDVRLNTLLCNIEDTIRKAANK
jgi:hypothetical protein